MFRIKRLYSFILGTFLPLILATFSVCLFILLMQFLWRYVDDMVGKGVGMNVLTEMFFYAAIYLIPLSLPLAILLASLMTFGNLGEHFELLAMKSSGISLIRIMKPLIIFVIFISGISFFFQNNIVPPTQAKLYTIIVSLKQKSPELNIPQGSFYKEITGYNIYVRSKTKDGLLKDLMIYDYSSNGYDQADVIVADSGRLKVSDNGEYIMLTLYNGESFGNFSDNKSGLRQAHIPYRRESFSLKEILIEYDTNFNLADESIFQNRDISKNLNALKTFADSMQLQVDSMTRIIVPNIRKQIYENTFKQRFVSSPIQYAAKTDTSHIHDFQLLFENSSIQKQIRYLEDAQSQLNIVHNDYFFQEKTQSDIKRDIRLHKIQIHKKFSLSLACLFFLFIGAPLGAIVRKGGLGMPAVLSVIIFLLYYSVDTFGEKVARQGAILPWQGEWLSSVLLISLGAFFTYKAVNDSVIMNPDSWKIWLQRLTGKREVRVYSRKEVIMVNPDYRQDLLSMEEWNIQARNLSEHQKRLSYFSFWNREFQNKELEFLKNSMENWIEDLQNSDQNLIIGKLMDYPIIEPFRIKIVNKRWEKWICMLIFPIGLAFYFFGLFKKKQIGQDIQVTLKVNEELEKEIITLLDKSE